MEKSVSVCSNAEASHLRPLKTTFFLKNGFRVRVEIRILGSLSRVSLTFCIVFTNYFNNNIIFQIFIIKNNIIKRVKYYSGLVIYNDFRS